MAPSPQAIAVDANGHVVVTGPGYVRTIIDTDGDGQADWSMEYCDPTSGGTGLAIDGSELMLARNGGVESYDDSDFNGVANSGPSMWLGFEEGDYGVHGLASGPDGSWLIAGGLRSLPGNQSERWGLPSRRQPQAGALLEWSRRENPPLVLAHGFRNPYDIAFNFLGDLFAVDDSREESAFLPGEVPASLIHVEDGAHYGWLSSDPAHSTVVPRYFAHTAQPMLSFERGVPRGLVSYRHYQFPERYRDGLFVADWLQGRVDFVTTSPFGASYQAFREPFLEASGRAAFTPTDLAVLPDGSLLVAAGGRHLPGGLLRVQYVADPQSMHMATNWSAWAFSEVASVLSAPQPFDAWSRAIWTEPASNLGRGPFEEIILNPAASLKHRIRAVEILTELWGGLGFGLAESAAQSPQAEIRARVAWSLGREPCQGCLPILGQLARDPAPYVRVHALDALCDHAQELDMTSMQQALGVNLAHDEPRVRRAAIRLATFLTEPAWNALRELLSKSTIQARLTGVAIALQRTSSPPVHVEAVKEALRICKSSRDVDDLLETIHYLQVGLGFNPSAQGSASIPLLDDYRSSLSLEEFPSLTREVSQTLNSLFPTRAETVNRECARLLGMLQSDEATLADRLLKQIHSRSSAPSDMHYLAVLCQLPSSTLTNVTKKLAQAFITASDKLPTAMLHHSLQWTAGQTAILQTLLDKIPGLSLAFLTQANLAEPGHEFWVRNLDADYHQAIARRFLDRWRRAPTPAWSLPLVELLSSLPALEIAPDLRRHWPRVDLRDAMIPILAKDPKPGDRDKYLWGLFSEESQTVGASLSTLLKLPIDAQEDTLVAALRLLRRLWHQPEQRLWRRQIVELIGRETGYSFDPIPEPTTSSDSLEKAYAPLFDYMSRFRPNVLVRLDDVDGPNPGQWEAKFNAMKRKPGSIERGRMIFQRRGCQSCHGVPSQLGPSLAGIGQRLTSRMLFDSVIFPNRTVASGYRATVVELADRSTHAGVVAYDSFDTLILQTSANSALRLRQSEIRSRHVGQRSFMPSGLLQGMDDQSLADLFRYLSSRTPPP